MVASHLRAQEQRDAIERYAKTIKTWRIKVYNDKQPKAEQIRLRLYPELSLLTTRARDMWLVKKSRGSNPGPLDPRHEWIRRGGPLDINVCPTLADAECIAAAPCRLLNRCPADIITTDFPEIFNTAQLKAEGNSMVRKVIELLSLSSWMPDFDYRNLRYVFRAYGWRPGSYGLDFRAGIDPPRKKQAIPYYRVWVPAFHVEERNNTVDKPGSVYVQFASTAFTKEDIDKLPPVPAHFAFKCQSPPGIEDTGLESLPMESLLKFIDYLFWRTFGHVGTSEAWRLAPKSLSQGSQVIRQGVLPGPYGGKQLFGIKMNLRSIHISPDVARTIVGVVPVIFTNNDLPMSSLALALQSAYNVFKRTEDILKSIEELFVAIQELYDKKSILTVDTYCTCQDDAHKREEAHYCMLCLELFPCHTLAWTKDGRLVCFLHFKKGPIISDTSYDLQRKVQLKARNCEYKLRNLSESDRKVIGQRLLTRLTSNGFLDEFNGERRYITGNSPLRMNVDATFPLFKLADRFFVHHTDNVGLTTEFLNSAKGDDVPILLALASDAVKTQRSDLAKIARLELGVDHCFMVRIAIPFSLESRIELARGTEDAWWKQYLANMRTGVYDGVRRIYNYEISCWSGWMQRDWNRDTITRLDKVCRQIETSPFYNPQKLKLPRGTSGRDGLPGAPWIWNPAHQFIDHNWDFLSSTFMQRFKRMDRTCDWANDHDHESSETLFLACVVLWFRLDGGKDELLGLRMSLFVRHPLRFSIGRALHVPPGSVMKTGWQKKHPDSLSQYKDAHRTITIETWFSNRAKSNFPVTKENIENFTAQLKSVSMDSKHWDKYPPDYPPTPLNLPRTCRQWFLPLDHQARGQATGEMEEVHEDSEDDNAMLSDIEDNDELYELGDEAIGEGGGGVDGGNAGSIKGGLDNKIDYLLSFAKLIPEADREDYVRTVIEVGAEAAMKSKPHDEIGISRIDIFQSAIITAGTGDGVKLEDLAKMSVETWQQLGANIDHRFAPDELKLLCRELHKLENFR